MDKVNLERKESGRGRSRGAGKVQWNGSEKRSK